MKAYNFIQFHERLNAATIAYHQKDNSLKDIMDEWLSFEKSFNLPQNKVLACISIIFCQCAYRVVLTRYTGESRETYHYSIYDLSDCIENILFVMDIKENVLAVVA